MSVDVSPITIAGSPPSPVDLSAFSDTFNRASSSDLGTNWLDTAFRRVPTVDPIDSQTFSIGAQVDAVQGLNIDSIGNNNPNTQWPGGIFAIPTRRKTANLNQFVQATFIRMTGSAGNLTTGIELLCNDQLGNFYSLEIDNNGPPNNIRLTRYNQTTPTDLTTYGNLVVQGDVIRLEAVVTNPAQVTLSAFRNAVLIAAATVDAAAGRLQVGYTGGFYNRGMAQIGGVGAHAEWRNFSCGVL